MDIKQLFEPSILQHFFFVKYKNTSEGHGRSFHDYVLVF